MLISDNPVSFDNLHPFEKPSTPQLSVIGRSRCENTYQKSVLTRAFIYWAVKRAHVALIDVWCGRGLARVCFWRKLEQKCDFVFNYVILEELFNVYIWSSVSFNVWGILLLKTFFYKDLIMDNDLIIRWLPWRDNFTTRSLHVNCLTAARFSGMLKIIIIRLYIKLFIRIGVDGLQIKFLHHVGLIPACLVAK